MAARYKYVIVGAGLAGASAVEGIRERDSTGSILLLGSEKQLPYDRPPLTKKLWFGKKTVEEIFLHGSEFYARNRVVVTVGSPVVRLDPATRTVEDSRGQRYGYEKLLLATGGIPRHLSIPGGDLENILYYRTLAHYLRARELAQPGASILVVGGGFIGSEIAAALSLQQVQVSMVFPEPHVASRIFPEGMAKALDEKYRRHGVRLLAQDSPTSFIRRDRRILASTVRGEQMMCDLVIAGIGIFPAMEIAQRAGLPVSDGIVVNDRLQTSYPNIWAAGDNAFFPYLALEKSMRVEHWDNALRQGKLAGYNMAGADEPYTHMPYFFSDIFELGYEAVGEISSSLDVVADWQKDNDVGVLYYLKDGRIRGIMLCNVWNKVEAARNLIREGRRVERGELSGLIM